VEVRDLQKIKLGTTDVIVSVFVPYGPPRMQLKYYKAAARHRNAHAAVNAGFSVVMDDYMVRAALISTLHGS
jgi:xanthine dehydrogenase iron-sulfur cluster and FAD-binding subunit A